MIRIIAGEFRSRKIETLPGLMMRPTASRVREAVFSSIHHRLPGTRMLDLFAGSGAVGIEAISRGANEVVLADRSRDGCAVIRRNLAGLSIEETRAKVLNLDYKAALSCVRGQYFDFIYLDPPYGEIDLETVFEEIKKQDVRFGTLIGECKILPQQKPANAILKTVRRYGKAYILFYENEEREL